MNFKRIEKLKAKLKNLNGMLLTNPADIFYYTGYWPSTDCFLLIADEPVLFANRIETGAEQLKCKIVTINSTKDIKSWLKGRIGFDESRFAVNDYIILKKWLKPAGYIAASVRAIKEMAEIEAIQKSQRVVKRILPKRFVGKMECNIAKTVIMEIVKSGGRPAFEPIIASGANGWYIHHSPTTKIIKPTDLVIVDIGARFKYYCSDITRTFCAKQGKREKEILENVKNIQAELIDSMADGIEVKDITKKYEQLLTKAGYKPLHSWGHSIGLEPHEPIGDKIRAGMTLTVEPGIYIKDFGGCRIEDVVVIKKDKAKIV
jgi:Xaa-Pro aminopeptidase